MTVNQSQPYHSFEVAVRDSAADVCTEGAWNPDFDFFSGLPATVEANYLVAGHTYYIRLSHGTGNYSDTYVQLNLHCPDACPRPISVINSNIQQTKATLQWQNNELSDAYEFEVRPLSESFTGTPNYSGTGNSRQITGLQALHEYHWRVRNVCSGGIPGTWSDSLQFLTLPYCGGGPAISCNDTVTVSNGMGIDFLVGCGEGNGNERYFNFTPAYSGIYTIQITGAQYFGHFGFLIKPGNLDCNAANWTCLGIPIDVGYGVQTGFLEGGQTYNIAVNRPEYLNQYYNFKIDFAIQCPPTCLPPNNLHTIAVDHQLATLAWNQISADQSWEIEVVPVGQPFTGIPNYFSTSTSTVAGNLQPITNYQWRVRALCGAYGQSDWSASSTFRTAMDCGLFPPLQCGQSLDLFFPEGNGYYLNMSGCGSPLSGTEVVLTFTVDDNGGQRQLHFPQTANLNKFALFIKDLGTSDCPGPANSWTCKANSPSNPVLLLNNLVQGHTYQVLIKKRASTGAVTLPLGFYCDSLPCDAPTDPYTQLSNTGSGTAKLFWTTTSGPWHYEASVHAVNAPYSAVNSNLNSGVDAFSWATLQADSLYDWQVRTICNSGDSSDWVPGPRFRAPFNCLATLPLACDEPVTLDFPPGGEYDFVDACAIGSGSGRFELYRINPTLSGEHFLRILSTTGTSFNYALTSSPANCSGISTPWSSCHSIAAPGDFSLGTLTVGQTYYLQVSRPGAAAGMQAFELLCPCPPVSGAQGIEYPDGMLALTWTAGAGVIHWEIELVPIDSSFDGQGTFLADTSAVTLTSAPGSGPFKFRIRSVCNGTMSTWTGPVYLHVYPNCPAFPVLGCGDTLLLNFINGPGLFDHHPCGQATPGREAYFKIVPAYSGVYRLKILSITGSAGAQFGWLSNCEDPNSAVNCLGGWGVGSFNLGYLEEGQEYTVAADSKFTNGGIYQLTLGCDGPPANDGPLWLPGPAFNITVNDSCQVFTNMLATPDTTYDPDPSLPPGNWYDGPEHSVWFIFTAPPGGTVQIRAESDLLFPMDPQIALLQLDSLYYPYSFVVLATGEDQTGTNPQNAVLNFTGLNPGDTYYVFADGAYDTQGRFCLQITDEPLLSDAVGVCESFARSASPGDTSAWINLYAANSDPHVNGPLLAALRTPEPLGQITISSEILSDVPLLPGGQKILPRYFNIETELAPQQPVQLRLFFTPQELADFNLAQLASTLLPADLSVSHYDGNDQDCDPANNDLPSGILPVQAAQATWVGENGLFYLETTVNSFSEFGAGIPGVVGTKQPEQDLEVLVLPNPTTGSPDLQVQFARPTTLWCELWNTTGQSVWRSRFETVGVMRHRIPMDGLPAGVYQLRLSGENGTPLRLIRVVKL